MEKSEILITILLVIAIIVSVASIVIMQKANVGVTGQVTGSINASINEETTISMVVNSIAFGNLALGASASTPTNKTSLRIKNDGSVNVNVTAQSNSALFSSSNGRVFTVAGNDLTGLSSVGALSNLAFANNVDEANVAVAITVPSDEPAGAKVATITFTSSAA